jgi:hypothetical protein
MSARSTLIISESSVDRSDRRSETGRPGMFVGWYHACVCRLVAPRHTYHHPLIQQQKSEADPRNRGTVSERTQVYAGLCVCLTVEEAQKRRRAEKSRIAEGEKENKKGKHSDRIG